MQDMDAVYRRHFRMVYQYLMSLTHQPDVAEELAQETFCQAVSSIHCYDGSCKITTWLCAKYPKIKICGSSGPSADGKDFDYGWEQMRKLGVDMVDEQLKTIAPTYAVRGNIDGGDLYSLDKILYQSFDGVRVTVTHNAGDLIRPAASRETPCF